jgi:hypothetical protein
VQSTRQRRRAAVDSILDRDGEQLLAAGLKSLTVNEDVSRCAIYDGNVGAARLMRVESMIGASPFKQLPVWDKMLRHSRVQEMMSGQPLAPGLLEPVSHELTEKQIEGEGAPDGAAGQKQ